ncbi:MATE family efflux transporter [Brachyspira pilosicoli]|uniref:Multidrug-efflux transporter n=2 Tax=Brachyspira pilosicoli TaxID=52584 RepID=D8IER8_BRAP9|nr:MATE family efflux transporter [Brachyspira pilosicoli]ADK31641.1 Na+-driven multidrug efflux pump [Brachyspira pilosicoli 95/1000]MBW5377895.1 MATE family efflux transporter [Brachyspira pilosicoli]MBW5382890.1 MATE family efflux transporter [Brachyspira pilosicoli]MBW5400309.1 MATE family efflux transporter [Brachyspira pilosicoli]WIH80416.1 MATE family efflux transporter [Brachyspira pilosicoli]
MSNHIGKDLTESKVSSTLITLLVPILLSNTLNVVYNIVDSIWIGNIIGPLGLSAVAVSFPITLMMGSFAFGVNMANGVIVSQYYGAKDYNTVSHVIKVSTTLGVIILFTVGSLMFIFAKKILIIMNTPKDALDMAVIYLRITIIGLPFAYSYFFISSILRAVGDSVRPLIFLIVSSIVNIILDPILIKGFFIIPAMGLKGAAIATVISQCISVLISTSYLKIKNSFIKINPFIFTFDINITKKIMKLAIPISSNQFIVAFGWLIITRLISSFGDAASATVAIVNRVESLFIMPIGALGNAVMTMSAQNIGANKFDRVKEIFKNGIVIGIIISSVMSIFSIVNPHLLINMFTKDLEVFEYSKSYIYTIMPIFIFYSIMFVCNGVINGAGKTIVIMIFSTSTTLILRTILAYALSEKFALVGIWASMGICYIINTLFSLYYYKSNKWQKNSNITQ